MPPISVYCRPKEVGAVAELGGALEVVGVEGEVVGDGDIRQLRPEHRGLRRRRGLREGLGCDLGMILAGCHRQHLLRPLPRPCVRLPPSTIVAPTDDAFSSLKKPSLANLTRDQLRSLLLSHALPQFYSLADFRNLSQRNPVTTFAGGQYTLNFSDASGLVRVDSGWANPGISSSVMSTDPVAVYEVKRVLLPVAIFGAAPPPAPAPAPAPDVTKSSDLAPSASTEAGGSSPRTSTTPAGSSSSSVDAGIVSYFVLALIAVTMVRL